MILLCSLKKLGTQFVELPCNSLPHSTISTQKAKITSLSHLVPKSRPTINTSLANKAPNKGSICHTQRSRAVYQPFPRDDQLVVMSLSLSFSLSSVSPCESCSMASGYVGIPTLPGNCAIGRDVHVAHAGGTWLCPQQQYVLPACSGWGSFFPCPYLCGVCSATPGGLARLTSKFSSDR